MCDSSESENQNLPFGLVNAQIVSTINSVGGFEWELENGTLSYIHSVRK